MDSIEIVAPTATLAHMEREVSVRDLRNSTASVVAELEAGVRLTLTVNRRPVADIVPHFTQQSPWVPASGLRSLLDETPADAGLLDDLAGVRGVELVDD
jgi:antitoxin (DNA-binding transcriptional repressor) of toxin-antitoxin stability system